MQTGTGLVYRQPLIRFSHSLRRWLVSCAATSKTTPHSSLSMRHFTTSALLRMDLEAAGLGFDDGVEIEGVGEVDLVIEDWVVVELDGYTYHCDEYQFGLDRWRDRRLVARGFLPLRFTRKDVYAHQVVPDVLRVLERWGVSKSDTKAATSTECV